MAAKKSTAPLPFEQVIDQLGAEFADEKSYGLMEALYKRREDQIIPFIEKCGSDVIPISYVVMTARKLGVALDSLRGAL